MRFTFLIRQFFVSNFESLCLNRFSLLSVLLALKPGFQEDSFARQLISCYVESELRSLPLDPECHLLLFRGVHMLLSILW